MRRSVIAALAVLLGVLLPVPAVAMLPAVPVPQAPGVPDDAEDPGDGGTGPRSPQDREDVLEDEAGVSEERVGLPWLSQTLEELALDLRAKAGLPSTEPMPQRASGELQTVRARGDGASGEDAQVRAEQAVDAAEVRTVRVRVERGLEVDGQAFGRFVMDTLNDERGWGYDGSVRFERTSSPSADIDVVLASPDLTDELCVPLDTAGEYSCGRNGRAVLNAVRWSEGADPFLEGGGTMTGYREYLVNHEVGHLLGHPHVECSGSGDDAQIMVQQSISLGGCKPNGWPSVAH
ncbi:DUF3152 domain-containing protein [Georgenia alba]|uniref:DUF3152 domain-containing protein n=1 Tax=Georgenia alba TaxID=2233858 RepID=A0ABW2QAE7_9MICO